MMPVETQNAAPSSDPERRRLRIAVDVPALRPPAGAPARRGATEGGEAAELRRWQPIP